MKIQHAPSHTPFLTLRVSDHLWLVSPLYAWGDFEAEARPYF